MERGGGGGREEHRQTRSKQKNYFCVVHRATTNRGEPERERDTHTHTHTQKRGAQKPQPLLLWFNCQIEPKTVSHI